MTISTPRFIPVRHADLQLWSIVDATTRQPVLVGGQPMIHIEDSDIDPLQDALNALSHRIQSTGPSVQASSDADVSGLPDPEPPCVDQGQASVADLHAPPTRWDAPVETVAVLPPPTFAAAARRGVAAWFSCREPGAVSMTACLTFLAAGVFAAGTALLMNLTAPVATPPSGPAMALAPVALAKPAPVLAVQLPSQLTRGIADNPGIIVRRLTLPPSILCDTINLGTRKMEWLESPLLPGVWECMSGADDPAVADSPPDAKGDAEPVSEALNLFSMARGSEKGAAGYVRLKVSGATVRQLDEGTKILAERVASLFGILHWPLPSNVETSIRRRRPFEISDGGTTIRMVKELIGQEGYNVIITFPAAQKSKVSEGSENLPIPFQQNL